MPNVPNAAYAAFGAKIHVSDGASPPVFYEVYNVADISGPNPTIANQETTGHNTADPEREFLPTLKDNGDMQFTVRWAPEHATHAGPTSTYSLEYQWRKRSRRTWRVVSTDPSARAVSFTGFISAFPHPAHAIDGILERQVTVKISGPITYEYQQPA